MAQTQYLVNSGAAPLIKTWNMAANGSLADQTIFIADRAYTVIGAREVHSTAGSDAGTVSIDIKKDTGTGAPVSGNTVLASVFDAKGTANTVVSKSPTAVGADKLLAAGDRLSVDFVGTLTALAGVAIEVELAPA